MLLGFIVLVFNNNNNWLLKRFSRVEKKLKMLRCMATVNSLQLDNEQNYSEELFIPVIMNNTCRLDDC